MGSRNRWVMGLLPTLMGFGLGAWVVSSQYAPAQAPGGPKAPQAYVSDDPPYRALDANLFMQTAAEYRACCLQAYNTAIDRLKQAVAGKKDGWKPAVVLDLDETVFDNAGFQAMQLRSGLAYDQRLWDRWEEKSADRIGLIPGAKEFIDEAERLGVGVVYISNRNNKYREQTKAALTRLGLPLANESDLKLSDEKTGTNKTSRRQEAEVAYHVLLYVGDNLRDFDERFRFPDLSKATGEELDAAVRNRNAEVDATRSMWGNRWVILPNSAYGEWLKVLGRGKADLDRLVPVAKEK